MDYHHSDKIVISGLSGKGSNSNNLSEMKEQLYTKDDMITSNFSRFPRNPIIPDRFGMIPEITKFDHCFFNIPQREVDYMDPGNRMLLEMTIEAIFDAGISPVELRNNRTGFYIVNIFDESEIIFHDQTPAESFPMLGSHRALTNERLAYLLGIDGPNFLCDSACSSSVYAIERAYHDLKSDKIDYAMVATCNVVLMQNISEQFHRLGVLSDDGKCKTFDESADGYVRAEGVYCIILQKSKTARRQYAELVHCQTNCDGFKEMGITFPSAEIQQVLLSSFYSEVQIDCNDIAYLDAHGTGTQAGDPVEIEAIEKTICKSRTDPLLIGSVKTKMGHSECASGLSSLIKLCMIYHTMQIPPNINYTTPNSNIKAIVNGKIKVVTEVTPIPEGKSYLAFSNFGFGGANGHVLLKQPEISSTNSELSLTRLLCISGRTYEAIEAILHHIESRPMNHDFLSLLNSSFNTYIEQHDYRAYVIIIKDKQNIINIYKNMELAKPLDCFFDSQVCFSLFKQLMNFNFFKNHLKNICDILNIVELDMSREDILTILIIQTGIVELLKVLNIKIANFSGSGIGDLTAAYADGVINLKQAIIATDKIKKLIYEKNINSVQLTGELRKILKMIQRPTKWKVSEAVNGNLSQYLANCLLKTKPFTKSTKRNLLIVTGNEAIVSEKINHIILNSKDEDFALLNCIGKLYQLGYSTNLTALYEIQWPVKVGTPMIGPLIKWKHEKSWNWLVRNKIEKDTFFAEIALSKLEWQHIEGHNIDGRILFPCTGYLYLAWKIFSPQTRDPIRFENVKFLRAYNIPLNGDSKICFQINRKTGSFQFLDNDTVIVTGTIQYEKNFDEEWVDLPPVPEIANEDLMTTKDIYKELRLRGYYYKGHFRQLQTCNIQATRGSINWTEWIPFLDNMLQLKVLQEDTRSLYVPIKLGKIIINPVKHLDLVGTVKASKTKLCSLPVYNYKDLDIIRSGFIEIRGFYTTSIVKRQNPKPILESNIFIPYVTNLDTSTAVRAILQIALENSAAVKSINVMEILINLPIELKSLMEHVEEAINDIPLVYMEYSKIRNQNELDDLCQSENFIIIGHNLSKNPILRNSILPHLKPGCFLISRELKDSFRGIRHFSVLCKYTTQDETIVLLRANQTTTIKSMINISFKDFHWLEPLKEKQALKEPLLLYSENDPLNGIIGLTKCIIKESGCENLQSVLIDDETAVPFDIENEFYTKQLSKNLCFNVYKNSKWGSYRHVLIHESQTTMSSHSYVNNLIRGDVSSLSWIQGPLCISDNLNDIKNDQIDVHIYMAALNFHDVVLVTGKVTFDTICKDRKHHECLLGIEFAGRTKNGDRVMGIWESTALANYIRVNHEFIWKIPDTWTMAEALTVPCVYATLIYGLIMRANLLEGESILIHSATGGIGLAAINMALYYKCNIFVTVGTEEKRQYIIKNYPTIDATHIGNSRSTIFYELVLKKTRGKGVDVIINSLADEKLQASVKCLKTEGRFVEIGKYDLNNDSALHLELAARNAEYHGVMLDNIISSPQSIFKEISVRLTEGIKIGYVKPLPHTFFAQDELEKAFRYMTTGKHIGKIIIKIREEEACKVEPSSLMIKSTRRAYFKSKGSYILLGGLGGFGLELVDWLILRGAKNFVLVSRAGITTGYQRSRILLWESYGCRIKISTQDATTQEGCLNLLQEAHLLGDILGVFNLAVVLRDSLLENQTEKSFMESYKPKALATIHLDELTRMLAPNLEHFVVFSSITCGRGNVGQSNYGYSNSVMERICEKRHKAGLPAKAIQWGIISDVGLVADMKDRNNIDVVISGTISQRISNCLETMDVFMFSDSPIVSSLVLPEKIATQNDNDILSVVLNLMQIKNAKTVSPSSTFPELGMDSMMAVEIKQTLEREFELFLSYRELRNLTFTRLMEIANVDKNTTKRAA